MNLSTGRQGPHAISGIGEAGDKRRPAQQFAGGISGSAETISKEAGVEHPVVLFVDDEIHVLSALGRVFRRERYRVLTVGSGAEALAVFGRIPVQVVVSDFRMPQMDGASFLREVKKKYPETIRIMLTGCADVGAVMGAVNEGAVYKFITKPWNDDDLRLTVALALKQHELLRENAVLKDKNRRAQREIKDLSRLASTGQSNLGKILARRGAITADQLGKAEEFQRQTKDAMPDVLVKLGFVKEATIFDVLQKELKIETARPAEFTVSDTLFELVPESYCRKNCVLPLRLEDKKLTLAMADPADTTKVDDLRFVSGLNVVPVLARASEISERLSQLRPNDGRDAGVSGEPPACDPGEKVEVLADDHEGDIEGLLSSADVPPAIGVVNAIVSQAIAIGASDVHIEPKAEYSRVRFRVDGLLMDRIHLPLRIHPSLVSRIKVMAGMDIAERRKPQDGRVTVERGRKNVDLRVSSLPTLKGEKIVLRLLDRNATVREVGRLGLDAPQAARLRTIIQKTHGLFLMVGPTSSGKTTTLYAILRENATATKNFVTIEDPVEYFMDGAEQVHVHERIGLSFPSVLRSILRQDPDVIMLGEIRDLETAEVAFQAALTGHLVLSTVHANDTTSAIARLRDIGIPSHVIAAGLVGIVSQRLLRRVCDHCRREYAPSSDLLAAVGLEQNPAQKFSKGAGCDRCHRTGYFGRVGIFEILEVTEEVRDLIHAGAGTCDILQAARASGTESLLEDGHRKVESGESTCEELLRVLGPVPAARCPHCKRPVTKGLAGCPWCGQTMRVACSACGRAMERQWTTCPFCGGDGTKR